MKKEPALVCTKNSWCVAGADFWFPARSDFDDVPFIQHELYVAVVGNGTLAPSFAAGDITKCWVVCTAPLLLHIDATQRVRGHNTGHTILETAVVCGRGRKGGCQALRPITRKFLCVVYTSR